jgi:phosphotransferase family enzyme
VRHWTILGVTSSALIWTQPEWQNDAEQWIRARLTELGHSLQGPIDQPHVRPWGTVLRVPTNDGMLWFKSNIAPLAYEARLLELVSARRADCVPRLLAVDAASGWMLMADAGALLSTLHPEPLPHELWGTLLRRYAQLQLDVAPAAEELVAAGVPDRRPASLLEPFERVLETDRLIRPPTDGALAADEVDRVRAVIPRLREAVELLAALGLPDSVQHDDLHPWNVCVEDGMYRFIDWGDACISQPLLSLAIPLTHVDGDDVAARDAYLEPWAALASPDELRAACDAAVLLGQVTGVLKWALINSVLTDEERAGYEDVIPKRLRYLLSLACA